MAPKKRTGASRPAAKKPNKSGAPKTGPKKAANLNKKTPKNDAAAKRMKKAAVKKPANKVSAMTKAELDKELGKLRRTLKRLQRSAEAIGPRAGKPGGESDGKFRKSHSELTALLENSEQRYQDYYMNAPTMYLSFDAITSRIVECNNKVTADTGYSKEELVGSHVSRIFHPDSEVRRKRVFRDFAARGEVRNAELQLMRKDGHKIDVIMDVSAVRDEKGNVVLGRAVLRDVSGRKSAEEALRESDDQYRTLVETSILGIQISDLDGRIVLSNPAHHDIQGAPQGKLFGMYIWDFATSRKEKSELKKYYKYLIKEQPLPAPYFTKNKALDGREIDVRVDWNYMRDAGGEVTGICSIINDITERKRAEEALRESEDMFKSLSTTTFDVIFIVKDGVILEVSEKILDVFGYSAPEMTGRNVTELVAPESRDTVSANIRSMYDKAYEVVCIRKDGTRFIVEAVGTTSQYKGETVRIAAVRDITERKRADEGLKESEEKFRFIFETTNDGIVVVDPETRKFHLVNETFCRMLGYSMQEVARLGVEDIHPKEDLQYVLKQFERHTSGEISVADNIPVKRKDGTVFYADISRSQVDLSGKTYLTGIFRDITKRKKAEEALSESEEKFRAIFETSADGIVLADTRTRKFISANEAFCRMLGYSMDEIRGLGVDDIHPEEAMPLVLDQYERMVRGQISMAENIPVKKNEGKVIYADITATPVELGGKTYLVGVFRDITERKWAEELLTESEERYRTFIQNFLGIIYQAKAGSFKPDFFHGMVQEITGYTGGEFTSGKVRWDELVHPDDLPIVMSEIETLNSIPDYVANIEYRIRRKDGTTRWVNDISRRMTAAPDTVISQGAIYDITERKRAEEALRRSEEKYRTLFKAESDTIFMVDEDTAQILDANDAATEMYGYTREEFLKLRAMDLSAEPEKTKKSIKSLKSVTHIPIRYHKKKDGTVFPVEISASYFELHGKKINISTIRDITERKRAEKELRRKAEHIQKLLDAFPCFAVILKPNREIVALNKIAREMGGDVGKICHKTLGQSGSPCPWCMMPEMLKSGELQHIQTWGLGIFWDAYWIPIEKDLYLHFAFDITESEKMKEELLKAQKLESVGVLAGGIAHDFNNLLTSVFGTVSLAKMYSEEGGQAFRTLEETERMLQRTKGLTHQLLTFAKGGAPIKKTIDVSPVIRDSVSFALSGSKSKSDVTIAAGLPAVEADENQLAQVLFNIVTNAKEAMPQGGIVKVTAESTAVTAESGLSIPEGDYITITVADTGEGIDEKHMGRIFDPYFTTKSEGSGLGLAVAYSILHKHGGHISAESTPGKGSTFTIYLPASDNTPPPSKELESKDTEDKKGTTDRVLVMDDDEIVRFALGEILDVLGYDAILTKDGAEAIETYRKAADKGCPFDAVILDITVPGGMGGEETLKMLLEMDADVKAVVSSGYSDDEAIAKFTALGFKAALAKPYDLEELRKTLAKVIDG